MHPRTYLLLACVGLAGLVASVPPAKAADAGADAVSWFSTPLDAAVLGTTRAARAPDADPAEDGRIRVGVVLFDELESPRPRPSRGTSTRTGAGAGTASFHSSLAGGP